jgi:PAS domain S-box-containing protein
LPLFTFYCRRPDGSATTWQAHDLPSAQHARERAEHLLREHTSSSHVTVFDEDVEVLTAHRTPETKARSRPLSVAKVDAGVLRRTLDGLGADPLDIALIATTAGGAVAYWNAAAAGLYGWSLSEALGRNVVDLTATTDSRMFAKDILQKLQAGHSWAGEIKLRHRDGAEFRAFVADIPLGAVEDGDGLIVGASAEASRRQAVEAFQPALLSALRHNLAG